jgi:6-phosphofructokinase 1
MEIPLLEELRVERLGESTLLTPLDGRRNRFIDDSERVLLPASSSLIETFRKQNEPIPSFELAGARKRIFFDPKQVRCGIITCGGICPGLNDVIRSITLTALETYGVSQVWGFRYGFEGLTRSARSQPLDLNSVTTRNIQDTPGTVIGSSRGPQCPVEMLDTLQRYNINMLFAIGGEGTLQGASAIASEIKKRDLKIAVIGIPKTIDNDLSWIERSFGFLTAVEAAREAIVAAHSEAVSAYNGVGLVKLMGRHSGFIAAHATLATSNVNFCLVPEVPFTLEGETGFLAALENRLLKKEHAVIVVGEGAGQELMESSHQERDLSGNIKFHDIGAFLKQRIKEHFHNKQLPITIKYIDPSYTIRSLPANAVDSEFCVILGQCAVHAAMAGRTNMVIGAWNQNFTHIPIPVVTRSRKQLDLASECWQAVLGTTHQPTWLG